MFVYRLLAPLATAFLIIGYHREWEQHQVLRPIITGLIAYIPAWVIRLILDAVVAEAYSGAGLFLHVLLFEHLVPVLLAVGFFYLLCGELRNAPQASFIVGMSSFVAGFFTLEAILYLALGPELVTPYDVLVLPTLRLLIIVVTPLLVWALRAAGGLDRYIWIGLSLLAIGAVAVISFLNGINYHLVSYVLSGVLVALVLVPYLLLSGVGRGGR
jgi:hypothetical protein